jgi:hypothetical protein
MMQLYFLSVIANVLAGLVLGADYLGEKFEGYKGFSDIFTEKPANTLLLGVFVFLLGFLKLVFAIGVPVVGDLFPALIGLFGGFILIFDYYKDRSTVESSSVESMNEFFTKFKPNIGALAIAVALLHFFLPRVIFL